MQQLAAECSSLPNCQSFNTNGYLKQSVKTLDQFQRLTGDPCRGLYVKEGQPGRLQGRGCSVVQALGHGKVWWPHVPLVHLRLPSWLLGPHPRACSGG